MAESKIVKWVVFPNHNIKTGISTINETNRRHFVVIDADNLHGDKFAAAGFSPSNKAVSGAGIWYAPPETNVPLQKLRQVFGEQNVILTTGEQSIFAAEFANQFREKTRMNANAFFNQRDPVGFNAERNPVYDTPFGRVVVTHDSENPKQYKFDAEHTQIEPDNLKFMRATNKELLDALTHTFASRVFWSDKPVYLKPEHLDRFYDKTNKGNFSRREYEEALEAAAGRVLREQIALRNTKRLDNFDIAQRMYDGLPPLETRTGKSVALQQYSTPLPMSVLMQSMLGNDDELNDATVLEPTIGNGSLVSTLLENPDAKTQVYGLDLDEHRLSQLDRKILAAYGDASKTDFRDRFEVSDGFDFVVGNPPFGDTHTLHTVALPPGSAEPTMTVQRLDHLILLNALHARKDIGRAVFITGADSVIGGGEIKGRSKFILNYLHTHYDDVAVAEISGNLYKKQGAGFPTRLYYIGPRRTEARSEFEVKNLVPEKLPVVLSYQQLKEFAEKVIEQQINNPLVLTAMDLETEVTPPVVAETEPREDSLYQTPYTAFSRTRDATTMIPANLSGPIYEALSNLESRRGTVDEFVASELEIDLDSLGQRFSPEQIDALALIFDSTEKGKGFLLADKMGVGKGRVIAATAVHAKLKGQIPTFFTVKPSLHTDFLERDITAIGFRHLFKNVIILNDGVSTLNDEGEKVVKPLPKATMSALMESCELPESTDLIMSTYSQICRLPHQNKKSNFLQQISGKYPLRLLLDESHNAAGESNTGQNLQQAIAALQHRGDVLYASGTPIKGAKNMRVYSKILPQGINHDELLNVINRDPLSMQEALNTEIAMQGSFVCRELDNSAIEKEFVRSPDAERNKLIADQFAEILRCMSGMAGEVSNLVNEYNDNFAEMLDAIPDNEKDQKRMQATSMNFGSRLYQISRTFIMSIKAPDVVAETLQALKENRKPIIAIQATGEALLRDFVTSAHEAFEDDTLTDESKTNKRKAFQDVFLDRPITFKDYLRRTLEKIKTIKIQTGFGNYRTETCSSPEFEAATLYAAGLIDKMPDDLTMTPIDYVRHHLEKNGYNMGEITGRAFNVDYLDNGGVKIYPRAEKADKSHTKTMSREFNNGEIDCLVLSVSGSTGISLQASPSEGSDLRPRRMIKWEAQANITDENQIDGRHNRTGQVATPEYRVVMSGLPGDDRLMMMFNNKNRSLTAASQSNRDSKDLIREVPDLLNVVGDQVAKDLLYEHTDLANKMDIVLPEDPEEVSSNLFFANKLSSRLILLPVEEQEKIYNEWQSTFTDTIESLTAEGKNPLEVKIHDWRATIVDQQVLQDVGEDTKGQTADDSEPSQARTKPRGASMFNQPVFISTIEYEQTMRPLKTEEVQRIIDANWDSVVANSLVDSSGRPAAIINYVRDNQESILRGNIPKRFQLLPDPFKAAMDDEADNHVKSKQRTLTFLLQQLPLLRPGAFFLEEDSEGKMVPNVVIRYSTPTSKEGYTRPSEYLMYCLQPGTDLMTTKTLSSMMANDMKFGPTTISDAPYIKSAFDKAEAGQVKRTTRVLTGNMFEAMCMNLREGVGNKIVFTDAEGRRQHGIQVKHTTSLDKLMQMAERIRSPLVLKTLLDNNSYFRITTDDQGDTNKADAKIIIRKQGTRDAKQGYRISTPGAKRNGGEVYLDPVLTLIPGQEDVNRFNLEFEKLGSSMSAIIELDQIEPVLEYLTGKRQYSFYVKDKEALARAREAIRDMEHAAAYSNNNGELAVNCP